MAHYLIVSLEAESCNNSLIDVRNDTFTTVCNLKWSASEHTGTRNGEHLINEIIRHANLLTEERGVEIDGICISLPGAVINSRKVARSSRLGILEESSIIQLVKGKFRDKCFFVNDVDCVAIGEFEHIESEMEPNSLDSPLSVTNIFVDEGVGSTTVYDGKIQKGAGVGGPLGRIIVEPNGSFNRQFSSRGCLEMYCSRPWVSTNMVERYLTEIDKEGTGTGGCEIFRNSLKTADRNDHSSVQYSMMNSGVTKKDPIAISVINEAARFLGLGISHIITLTNPHLILLSGGMFDNIPGFFDRVNWNARRYTWGLAWNNTKLVLSSKGRDSQMRGAVKHLISLLAQHEVSDD